MEFITTEAIGFAFLFAAFVLNTLTLLFAGKLRLAKMTSRIGSKRNRNKNIAFDYLILHMFSFLLVALGITLGVGTADKILSILVFAASSINFLAASIQLSSYSVDEQYKQHWVIALAECLSSFIVVGYILITFNLL